MAVPILLIFLIHESLDSTRVAYEAHIMLGGTKVSAAARASARARQRQEEGIETKKSNSPTGNRTRAFHVTGGDPHH